MIHRLDKTFDVVVLEPQNNIARIDIRDLETSLIGGIVAGLNDSIEEGLTGG